MKSTAKIHQKINYHQRQIDKLERLLGMVDKTIFDEWLSRSVATYPNIKLAYKMLMASYGDKIDYQTFSIYFKKHYKRVSKRYGIVVIKLYIKH